MKKPIITALILTIAIVLFNGCTMSPAAEKEFLKAGLAITLNTNFSESDAGDYTAIYESNKDNAVVIILKEDFSLFEIAGISTDISLNEYAQLTVDASGKNSIVEAKDGLTYFTHESTVDGVKYSYLAVVYRGSDAYWLVQFSTYSKDFDGLVDTFTKWAKTVSV